MVGPKFPITEDQIDMLVREFYTRIRATPDLGPIFADAVGTDAEDWTEHEARIASFWRNAIGLDRSFSGNPMLKHLANPAILPEHFPTWLALFRETAQDVLPPKAALGIAELADRIGKSLSWGLVQFRQPNGATPVLTRTNPEQQHQT